jgi:cyclic beta-1,2-glucan synthetase
VHVPEARDRAARAEIKRAATIVRAVVQALNRAQLAGESVTPAANWLLDNSHVIEQAIAAIRRDLPRRFYRQLPEMPGMGVPRVLAIAWLYVAQSDSEVSVDGFRALVDESSGGARSKTRKRR